MRFALIVSEKDMAGMNIRDHLIHRMVKTNNFHHNIPVYKTEVGSKIVRLYTINIDTVVYETLEKEISANFYIFATRHQSKSGEKTLSTHIPGNYGNAIFGGKDGELGMASALLMKHFFLKLNKFGANSGYRITLEATHHGPLIRRPVLFIEIGSKKEQWRDKNAGKIISDTIMESIKTYEGIECEVAIGFGGTHYCPNFNKIELGEKVALSHICPKYHIDVLNKALIQKMISSTYEKVDYALLDWKGLSGADKQKLLPLLEELKIRYKKTKDVK